MPISVFKLILFETSIPLQTNDLAFILIEFDLDYVLASILTKSNYLFDIYPKCLLIVSTIYIGFGNICNCNVKS